MGGGRCHSNGSTLHCTARSTCSPRRYIAPTAAATEGSPSSHMLAKCSSKLSQIVSATIATLVEHSPRNTAVSAPSDRQSTCYFQCAYCRDSDDRRKSRRKCASSTNISCSTRWVKSCTGGCMIPSVYHRRRWSRLSANNSMHDGMWARVRTDDVECSRWFEVKQGLRQACVLCKYRLHRFRV